MYVDFHHNSGWGMYIDRILKSRNPQNSNLVRKYREINYFSSRTKLEDIRQYCINYSFVYLSHVTYSFYLLVTIESLLKYFVQNIVESSSKKLQKDRTQCHHTQQDLNPARPQIGRGTVDCQQKRQVVFQVFLRRSISQLVFIN